MTTPRSKTTAAIVVACGATRSADGTVGRTSGAATDRKSAKDDEPGSVA